MKITSVSLYDNHTAVCAEIRHDLSADNTTYNVSLGLPSNVTWLSVALCVSDQLFLLPGLLQKSPEHEQGKEQSPQELF